MTNTPPQAADVLAHINFEQLHQTDSCRLLHGRGQTYDGLSFLSIDWYHPVILMTFFAEQSDEWKQELTEAIVSAAPEGQLTCIVHQARYIRGAPSTIAWGTLPEQVDAWEAGLKYRVILGAQQNTGFFLDMKESRAWLRERAEGKKVLNLFAYTCAFSVVAMEAGARFVANIDMSQSALRAGYINHRINDIDTRDVEFWSHDIFRSWNKLRKRAPYDIVIIDPPSNQRRSFVARKDYGRMVKRIPELLTEDADILACLNAPNMDFAFLRDTISHHCPQWYEQAIIPPPESFPDRDPNCGLKCIHYKQQTASESDA